MADLISRVTAPKKGIIHETDAPPLTVEGISVAYALGVGGGTLRPNQAEADSFVLQDISFELALGERIALVGPNGAGKSTLFKLIAGIVAPTIGRVRVFGRPPEKHTCIAYVPQRSQVDWSFPATVEDVVMMGRVGKIGLFRRPRALDRAIVQTSLERVNAAALAKKQIGELSGGQQQRVFIARAIAQEAELLLLDEPLTGLDAPSRADIFDILDTVQQDGVTALIATHDLELAAEHFDRIMLLNKSIIALDTPARVMTPQNLLAAYGGLSAQAGGNLAERV